MCTCVNPNGGAAPNNGIRCGQATGITGYCATAQACTRTGQWPKTDLDVVCKVPVPTELQKGQRLCKDATQCSDKMVVGNKRLEIEDNGNLVLYNGAKLEWSVEGEGIAMLKLQNDGNLVAYDASMGAKWAASWSSNGNKIKCCDGMGDKLKLQSDGNLVLFRIPGGNVAWAAK